MIAKVGEQFPILREPLNKPGAVDIVELHEALIRPSFRPGHRPRVPRSHVRNVPFPPLPAPASVGEEATELAGDVVDVVVARRSGHDEVVDRIVGDMGDDNAVDL